MRRGRVAAWGVAASLLFESVAAAHPLGTSSINRFEDFQYVGDGRFRVAYLLDFAEAPAYPEIDALDADHDGAVTPAEQQRYLASRLPVLLSTCIVEIDGEPITPSIVASHVETLEGEGGLQTLRIAAELSVIGRAPASGHEISLHVHDEGFANVSGWREIHGEDVGAADASTPSDAGAAPARATDARFVFRSRSASIAPAPGRFARAHYAAALALALVALAAVVTLLRRRA